MSDKMTVREVVDELMRCDDDGAVTVECEYMGDEGFSMAIMVDGNMVASWMDDGD